MQNDLRLKRHPLFKNEWQNRRRVSIMVDGRPMQALAEENLAAALWAGGHIALRLETNPDAFRGMYCGIGHCFECRVTVDGIPDVRSCLVEVREGMRVSLQVAATTDDGDGQI